ncbi:MAG: DUF4293 domain-containing protein [Tannerellaceae bacterium]|jgi:hypothetical protein|nr:DUF4293 domain-containing protein [Tannerellaceae bacterium]
MLQRIQSVYLLFITILALALSFLPLAVLRNGEALYSLDVFGVTTLSTEAEFVYPVWGLFVLTTLMALLALVTIFLYKKRILQIRICVFNAILMIGFYGFFAFLIYTMKQEISGLSVSVKLALSFPLLSLILDYLAIRNIGADEVLVRSAERLRSRK